MPLKETVRNSLIFGIAAMHSTRSLKGKSRIVSIHDVPPRVRDAFEHKMLWLKEHYSIVSLEQIYYDRDLDDSKLSIAITFDDGFKEQADYAAPFLRAHGMPATFFIPSAAIGAGPEFAQNVRRRHGNFEFVTHEDVKTLATDPLFEIGGHTMHHSDLGAKMSFEELRTEITEDKHRLEEVGGKPVRFFAYPFGSPKNLRTESMDTIRKEYLAAFTIVPAFWNKTGDLYAAGRDSLAVWDSDMLWSAWLKGGYDWMSSKK